MTDIHIGFDPVSNPEELNQVRLRAAIARLNEQPNPVDLLVLSGDLVENGDEASYDVLKRIVASSPAPVKPMVGNHDDREQFLRAFPDCTTNDGFIQYAVDLNGLRIIALDSLEIGRHGGAFCERRASWLSSELQAHPETPTLIFIHHPPIISGVSWMDPQPGEQWIERLGAVLRGHDQILALHCGHLHRQVLSSFCGIPLGITPSIAPQVSLDLREISPDRPDGRVLITTEPSTYALHYWDGSQLVTHYETVGQWGSIADYNPPLQPMIGELLSEREASE